MAKTGGPIKWQTHRESQAGLLGVRMDRLTARFSVSNISTPPDPPSPRLTTRLGEEELADGGQQISSGLVMRPGLLNPPAPQQQEFSDDFDYYNDEDEGGGEEDALGDEKEGLMHNYLLLARKCKHIARANWFGFFISLCIITAGVLVGMQMYEEFEHDSTVETLDLLITGIFAVECLLKIVAEGRKPWLYFIGKEWRWNVFDFVIVSACLVPLCFQSADEDGPLVKVVRLVRLMRVTKLVQQNGSLQIIVYGLYGGLNSIAYILLLLFLVFYLYAVAGVFAFRHNDPIHFGSFPVAMITLLRIATLDNWDTIMFINIFGCNYYAGSEYMTNTSLSEPRTFESWGNFYQNDCVDPRESPVVAPLFFVSLVIISSMVMLSLFIGAVTLSMDQNMRGLQEDANRKMRERLMARRRARTLGGGRSMKLDGRDSHSAAAVAISAKANRAQKMRKQISDKFVYHGDEGDDMEAQEDNEEVEEGVRMRANRKSIQSCKRAQVFLGYAFHGRSAPAVKRVQEKDLTGVKLWYYKLSKRCTRITHSPHFRRFITATIIVTAAMVGISTDEEVYDENQDLFDDLDNAILGVFVVEWILKIIAEGSDPLHYYSDLWNRFDFALIVSSLIPILIGLEAGKLIMMVRLLRLLRILRLVRSLPQLQVIVEALFQGLNSIGYITIILFLVFYIFACGGMLVFAENDPHHFGTLPMAVLALFKCATLEGWTDLLYINMFGCDRFGYTGTHPSPEECTNSEGFGYLAAAFFVIFTVIGSLILLTLFVGVVTTSMENAEANQKKNREERARAKEVAEHFQLPRKTVKYYRRAFGLLDVDGNNSLDVEEMEVAMQMIQPDISRTDVEDIFTFVDRDGNGEISFHEFLHFMVASKSWNDSDGSRRSSLRQSITMKNGAGVLDRARAALGDACEESGNNATQGDTGNPAVSPTRRGRRSGEESCWRKVSLQNVPALREGDGNQNGSLPTLREDDGNQNGSLPTQEEVEKLKEKVRLHEAFLQQNGLTDKFLRDNPSVALGSDEEGGNAGTRGALMHWLRDLKIPNQTDGKEQLPGTTGLEMGVANKKEGLVLRHGRKTIF